MSVEIRREEFYRNVWDHANDPFQMQFDARRTLEGNEVELLHAAAEASVNPDEEAASGGLRRSIQKTDRGIELLLQVTGLTRSKILMDLRAAAGVSATAVRIPTSHRSLASNNEVWALSAAYLLPRVRTVLGPLVHDDRDGFTRAVEALNQATWPGYIRQERAKRSGHEAEARIATLLRTLDLPFVPEEKADNPLVPDAQIGGVSFDIVVPDTANPLLVVKSTVHTSNIGQFGESKDALEMAEAKEWISSLASDARPTLIAFIDGIGFRSNRAGLDGVLRHSDEFCQFKTIWKMAVMAASAVGSSLRLFLPADHIDEHSDFLRRWDSTVEIETLEAAGSTADLIQAGEGYFALD